MHDKPCHPEQGIPAAVSFPADGFPPVVIGEPHHVNTAYARVRGANSSDKEASRMSLFLVWLGYGCWILVILNSIFSLCVEEDAKAIVELVIVVALPCLIFLGLFTKDTCYLIWLNAMNAFIIGWTLVWTILFMISLFSSTYDEIMQDFLILVVIIGWLQMFLNCCIFFYSFQLYRRLHGTPVVVVSTGSAILRESYSSAAYSLAGRGSPIVVGKATAAGGVEV
eukprot:GHVS01039521.1.p1 GENE.GHVS01039521.1~~GHVS01039521.1.p1  ORF type:complete len:224 (+),score=25.68 GHVS01039521.1:193-864(+)